MNGGRNGERPLADCFWPSSSIAFVNIIIQGKNHFLLSFLQVTMFDWKPGNICMQSGAAQCCLGEGCVYGRWEDEQSHSRHLSLMFSVMSPTFTTFFESADYRKAQPALQH